MKKSKVFFAIYLISSGVILGLRTFLEQDIILIPVHIKFPTEEFNLSLNTTPLLGDSRDSLHMDEVEGISMDTSLDGVHGGTGDVLFQKRKINSKIRDDAISKEEGTPSILLFQQSSMGQDKDELHRDKYILNNEELMLSQSNNIDIRSKWQMSQMKKYCAKYKQEKMKYIFPKKPSVERKMIFRHLLFDRKRKVLFCFIPKIGCTNARKWMSLVTGALPLQSQTWNHTGDIILKKSLLNVSFASPHLSKNEKQKIVKNFWKFTIVRNPLERLVSAFRNKLESPLDISSTYSSRFDNIKHSIFKKYHLAELNNWKILQGKYELRLKFETFIRWVVETPNNRMNEHFSPMIVNAQPCRVQYNFFANFKRMSSEMQLIAERLGVPHEYYNDGSYYKPGHETKTLMEKYYSTVSNKLKKKLFKYFYQELDFYYHLFPEDRKSHIPLLGVTELVG